MSERERCPVCDFPLPTDADWDEEDDGALCWSAIGRTAHRGPAIDWRARALEAEKQREESNEVARDALQRLASAEVGQVKAEARVEALEGALRAADYRLGEVSNYLGPFDHALMFRALSETIAQVRAALSATPPKPAPRPDAAEALRVAMEALEGVLAKLGSDDPAHDDYAPEPDVRAALEVLRAHVEPTPLETAVLTHTEELEAKAAPTPVVVTREVVEALSEFARTWARFGADCEPENAAARLVVAVGGALEAKP